MVEHDFKSVDLPEIVDTRRLRGGESRPEQLLCFHSFPPNEMLNT
jgi:hypothetical protein